MHWEDERYVRSYTRDTIDWLALSFEAQGLLQLLLRKVNRAGILELGRHGPKGVAAIIGHATRWTTIEPALHELLADGCVVIANDRLIVRNFIAAQEARSSDAQRQRDKRERERDKALAKDLQVVTLGGHGGLSHPDVTQERHAGDVTPNQPNQPNQPPDLQDQKISSAPPTPPEPIVLEQKARVTPALSANGNAAVAVSRPTVQPESKVLELLKPPAPDRAAQVFEYWRKTLGHQRTLFDKKRRTILEARLKGGRTVEELCRVVDGAKLSDWHMGRDPKTEGKRYDSIALLFRDEDQITRFIELAEQQTAGRSIQAPRSDAARQASLSPRPRAMSAEETAADLRRQEEHALTVQRQREAGFRPPRMPLGGGVA